MSVNGKARGDPSPFDGATILLTGGTGSVGRRLAADLLATTRLEQLIVVSRDDIRQAAMRKQLDDPRLHFICEDIAAPIQLPRVCRGVTILIHAAALKTVSTCEAAPEQAVRINVQGAANVLAAAAAAEVPIVVGLSSDKAVQATSVYGSTKLVMERMFLSACATGRRHAVVRLCNVAGSRGGIIEKLQRLEPGERVALHHPDMTRFFLSGPAVTGLIRDCVTAARHGDIFVPRAQSVRIADLIEAAAGNGTILAGTPGQGENLHETLIGDTETIVRECASYYVVRPNAGEPRPRPMRSDDPNYLLSKQALREFLSSIGIFGRNAASAAYR